VRLQVKGKNVDVTDSLKDYALQKLGKLETHLNVAARLELELAVEKNPSISDNQIAEGTIWTKGPVLRAKESSADMRASIDMLVEKLERQARRYRDKRRRSSARGGSGHAELGALPRVAEEERPVARKQERVPGSEVTPDGDAPAAVDVDGDITKVFPTFPQMAQLPGFETMIRSLRTAESLFHSTGQVADADLSPPITLWMKVLENYVHAWLGPRMAQLQREPAVLFDYVDRVIGASWPTYQRWLEPKWRDPTDVGGARVELPLRAIPNAVRELQEHRRKRLDSPLSVTEWARMMVLFAVDHPSGFKNLMKVGAPNTKGGPERTVSLAHRMHTLAAVRNLVTHRASAGVATLAAFRRSYYAAFEDLVALA